MIICFSYSKGGVGKTTISANVARVKNTKTGKYMDLFDLDSPQNGSYAITLNAQNIGLTVFKTWRVDETNPNQNNDPTIIAKKNSELIDNIINEYKGSKEKNIIVDCGGHDSDNIRKVLAVADVIITPISISDTEVNDFLNWNNSIIQKLIKVNKTVKAFVLFNKYHTYEEKDFSELKSFIEGNFPYFKVMHTTIGERKDYRTSFGQGKGVAELKPSNPARVEIESLAKEIEDIIEGN